MNLAMQKEVNYKMLKGFLDLVMLRLIGNGCMHGYQIITTIRKTFGIYFGPSTIYPLLNLLEDKKYIKGVWEVSNDRPKKVYTLTREGDIFLRYSEDSFKLILRKMASIEGVALVEGLAEISGVCLHLESPYSPFSNSSIFVRGKLHRQG